MKIFLQDNDAKISVVLQECPQKLRDHLLVNSQQFNNYSKRVGPQGWVAQNFALCSFSRSHFRSFCLSLGSSRGFLVVFGSAGAVKCARLEFSGCRVKPRRPSASKTPPKFHEKTPRERERKRTKWWRERETKERHLGRSGGGGLAEAGTGGSARATVRAKEQIRQGYVHTIEDKSIT